MASTSKERITIEDIVGLERFADENAGEADTLYFQSRKPPVDMGNARQIAYGGCAIALVVHAAYQALPKGSKASIYSVQGTYLGPAFIDRVIGIHLKRIRQTRSFSTFLVTLEQASDKGGKRDCMIAIVDFVVEIGQKTILAYTDKPLRLPLLTHHSKLLPNEQGVHKFMPKGIAGMLLKVFKPMNDLAVCKYDPSSVFTQNAMGLKSDAKTSQDDLPLTERTSYDWLQARVSEKPAAAAADSLTVVPPSEEAKTACLLAFVMDGALSFTPLAHSNRWLGDEHVEACSSLDFSLRFNVNNLSSTPWYLRELRTIAGRAERTYTESRLFQEQDDQSLILAATMTQQSVLRGKPIEKL